MERQHGGPHSTKKSFNLQVICAILNLRKKLTKLKYMGKKSRNKKNIKIEPEKTSKKLKKQAVEQSHSQSNGEQPKKRVTKQTIFGGILVLIMLSILISVGFLLFSKAFKATPIAKILPDKNVIFEMELNTNFEHKQVIKAENLLVKYPDFSKENLSKYIEGKFSVKFDDDVKPWIGRSMGFAYINSDKSVNVINEYYFAEVASSQNAEAFLNKNKTKTEYAGHDIYSLPNKAYATFIDDYMFLSFGPQSLNELIDLKKNSGSLYDSPKYRRIDDNLPINKVAFAYLDFSNITNNFLTKISYISESGISLELVSPLVKLFDADGLAIIATDTNFVVQNFLSLNRTQLKDNKYIVFDTKYKGELLKYLSPDALVFWGSQNLEYQVGRISEVLSGGNDGSDILFDNIIQTYTQKYFGLDTNFKNDILPLLKDEFAFDFTTEKNEKVYTVLVKLVDEDKDAATIEKLADNFIKVGGILEPKIVEHTLIDGTNAREVIAVPEQITKTEEDYKDYKIVSIKVGSQPWGIYHVIADDIAIISNNLESLKNKIDVINGDKKGLSNTIVYENQISPLLKNADEVSFISLDKFLPTFLNSRSMSPLLSALKSLSSGTNYFNDGIVTINYLDIR